MLKSFFFFSLIFPFFFPFLFVSDGVYACVSVCLSVLRAVFIFRITHKERGRPFFFPSCVARRFADFMSRGMQARLPINNFPLAALKSLSCLYNRSCCFSWTSCTIRASGKPELTIGTVFDHRQVDLIIHNSLYTLWIIRWTRVWLVDT